jgi:hypothetical protein
MRYVLRQRKRIRMNRASRELRMTGRVSTLELFLIRRGMN